MARAKLSPQQGRPELEVDPHSLGGRIRAARKRMGLTTAQLAELVGVKQPSISRTETGQTTPDETTLVRLAQELKSDFGQAALRKFAREPAIREIPVLAFVAGGFPIDEMIEGEAVSVDPQMVNVTGDVCALKVKGESMVPYHILDRDVLICRKTAEPRNRSVVVVDFRESAGELIGASVKFWYRRGDAVRLSSDPDAREGEKFDFSAAKLGKVFEIVGLIRSMK